LICLAKGKAVQPQETVPPIHRVPANAVIGRALEAITRGAGLTKQCVSAKKKAKK